jgi:hypothetical protein
MQKETYMQFLWNKNKILFCVVNKQYYAILNKLLKELSSFFCLFYAFIFSVFILNFFLCFEFCCTLLKFAKWNLSPSIWNIPCKSSMTRQDEPTAHFEFKFHAFGCLEYGRIWWNLWNCVRVAAALTDPILVWKKRHRHFCVLLHKKN